MQAIAVYAIPVLFAITVHEASHGYVARMFGDNTAYVLGRVTLNPRQAHRSAWHDRGSARHGDPDRLHVRLGQAGTGRLVEFAATQARHDLGRCRGAGGESGDGDSVGDPVSHLCRWPVFEERFFLEVARAGVQVNLVFMALNLLPIPPLDGGRIVAGLLPRNLSNAYSRIEPFGLVHHHWPDGDSNAELRAAAVSGGRRSDCAFVFVDAAFS